jgi:hypothetical protein
MAETWENEMCAFSSPKRNEGFHPHVGSRPVESPLLLGLIHIGAEADFRAAPE